MEKRPNTTTSSVSGNQTQYELPRRHLGIILWLLIGVLFLLFLALVWWYMERSAEPADPTSARPTAAMNQERESDRARAQTQALRTLSTSNELDAIKADLESTSLAEALADLDTIETELELLE